MYPYKNENSLKNNISNHNQITSKNIPLFNLKIIHTIFDSLNISLLILIFILSFLSFNSQKQWTKIYSYLAKTKINNNNLIDHISKTEEFYIDGFESLKTLKKTMPEDLIYIVRKTSNKKRNYFHKRLKYLHYGLKDSIYRRGY